MSVRSIMGLILSKSCVAAEGCRADEIPFRNSGEWLAALAFRLKIIYRKNIALPSACVAATKDRGMGQCVCAEHDDQPWYASVSENLKMVANRDHLNTNPINSTTPCKLAPLFDMKNQCFLVYYFHARALANAIKPRGLCHVI